MSVGGAAEAGRQLEKKYGEGFREYARKTKRFIPFVY